MKENKYYYFDGTMLIGAGKKGILKNVLSFEQTDIKREINKEYPEDRINPDLFFIFKSEESVDALIRALEEIKKNFESEVKP